MSPYPFDVFCLTHSCLMYFYSLHSWSLFVVAVTSILPVPCAHICLLWYGHTVFYHALITFLFCVYKHTLVCMLCFVLVLLIIYSDHLLFEFGLGACTHYITNLYLSLSSLLSPLPLPPLCSRPSLLSPLPLPPLSSHSPSLPPYCLMKVSIQLELTSGTFFMASAEEVIHRQLVFCETIQLLTNTGREGRGRRDEVEVKGGKSGRREKA